MKILLINKFLYPNGGSETYIFRIGQCLEQLGHEVEYFGMEHVDRIVGNRVNSYTSNMDFHTSKFKKLLYPFKIIYSVEARRKLRKVLQDFAPDVIHLNNFNFQLTPSMIYEIRKYRKMVGKHIPIIYTAHDYQWVCPNHMLYIPRKEMLCTACMGGDYLQCIKNRCIHDSRMKSALGAVEGYIYRWLKTYRHVDAVICPSDFMNQMLSNHPDLRSKTITMYNFVEEDSERETTSYVNNSYVLYFGRYSKEKGISTLLKACRKLPEIPFVFAGGGPLLEEVQSEGNIDNRGFLKGDKLKEVISGASLVVFASEWYENCPFSVMEAIQAGIPLVATNLGGTKELVKDKMTGELVEAQNADMLAGRIKLLWNDKEKLDKYAQNCRNNSFQNLGDYCAKLIEIYSRHTKS